jgi:hypothetical protein
MSIVATKDSNFFKFVIPIESDQALLESCLESGYEILAGPFKTSIPSTGPIFYIIAKPTTVTQKINEIGKDHFQSHVKELPKH